MLRVGVAKTMGGFAADRAACFVRKKLELNTESHRAWSRNMLSAFFVVSEVEQAGAGRGRSEVWQCRGGPVG